MIRSNLKFHANGKILLTGEYLILDGAEALAVPLHVGQSLEVNFKADQQEKIIHWRALEDDQTWFETEINVKTFRVLHSNDDQKTKYLFDLLTEASRLNRSFLTENGKYTVITRLEFNRNWGLGSSSTLIYLVAQWADVNPYKLFFAVENGSGYDIACASADSPVVYMINDENPQISPVNFTPPFLKNLYLIYLEKKQNSAESIINYKKQRHFSMSAIEKMNRITSEFYSTKQFDRFRELMEEHEELISSIIGVKPLKKALFPDFNGSVKSLGAWGGDFALVASDESKALIKEYFEKKGFTTFFELKELALL